MRHLGVVIALGVGVVAAGCWSNRPDTPVGMAPEVTLTLAPVAGGAAAEPPVLAFPRSAAQIGLRLTGDIVEIDHLMAEVAPIAAPDDARRWRVDVAPAAADGARGMVTLPAHALSTGTYLLTLWEGDARVVDRYPFRVQKDP